MVVKMKNIRDKVIKILKSHPEGLTTVEIAEKIEITRQSIAKYVCQLLDEGLIFQREVGTAKICYLKGKRHERKSF